MRNLYGYNRGCHTTVMMLKEPNEQEMSSSKLDGEETCSETTISLEQRKELSHLLWLLGRPQEWETLRQHLRVNGTLRHRQQAIMFLMFAINQRVPDDIIQLILERNPDVCNDRLPFQFAILKGASTNTRIVLEAVRQQSILRQQQEGT